MNSDLWKICYRIQPNYCTVRLGFSNYWKHLQLNIHQIRTHFKERSAEDFLKGIFKYAYAILFVIFFIQKHMSWVLVLIA